MKNRTVQEKLEWLQASKFGHADAEHEQARLKEFFVSTYAWDRLLSGDVDIVHGKKGSGKSAMYTALIQEAPAELAERNIHVIHGNHLDLIDQLPQDVPEGFRWDDFWFCYILVLCAGKILQENWTVCREIIDYLKAKQLLDNNPNNRLFLSRLSQFVWETRGGLSYEEVFRRSSMTANGMMGGQMNDTMISRSSIVTPMPTQPSQDLKVSWSSLLQHLHSALAAMGVTFWVALDKLDVVFSRMPHTEIQAVNGLLRCHEDMISFSHIRLRLFLQTQALRRAIALGLTNPDYLTTSVQELRWDKTHLLWLLVRRLLSNPGIVEYLGRPLHLRIAETFGGNDFAKTRTQDVILGTVLEKTRKQVSVLKSIFEKPEFGQANDDLDEKNADNSLLSRIMAQLAIDGTDYNPRDFITFLHYSRDCEIAFLQSDQHGSMRYLLSKEATSYAIEKISYDKLLTLTSRYNLMIHRRLEPYLGNLRDLMASGYVKRKVSDLLMDWTSISGGDERLARETLAYCYEHHLFVKNRSAEDELRGSAPKGSHQLTVASIYRPALGRALARDDAL
ncbi:P-loop ATPase, Sll1717 family [Asticcacaulis solisilvae]|uniref:P-loop ATPase, Sll1717 family n=1 Tax=Asticcacaulis solisilvae TaxID=1217274 RepID=UPI003FD7DFD4